MKNGSAIQSHFSNPPGAELLVDCLNNLAALANSACIEKLDIEVDIITLYTSSST